MDRRPIQQLSAALVNRIAAGEVIERPANVVKELVENAVDAGASSVTVEVEDGGRALIRVTDDGGGIPAAELSLAFASHATSKLVSDDDLFRILTMGFRGEALASIGSVSHSRILSRTEASDAAWEIHNRGGELSAVQAAAGNVGTVVEVRNLFFNTPARRKFIKGTATEFGHISDMLTRLALPHPGVAFRLLHNNKQTLDLPRVTSPEERWLAAWPKEFREEKLTVDVRDAELRLRGVVGLPDLARPTTKYQYLYLNGRHIRDRFIMHALKEAFRGLTEPGRHPAAILMLDVPPQDVDVNVHPTKIEVRFRDSGRVHGLVLSGVRERLNAADLTPTAIPMRSDVDDARDAADRTDLRQKMADFFKQQFAPAGMQPAVGQPMLEGLTPGSPSRPMEFGFQASGFGLHAADSDRRMGTEDQPGFAGANGGGGAIGTGMIGTGMIGTDAVGTESDSPIRDQNMEISDSRFEISDSRFEISNLRSQISNLKSQLSNLQSPTASPGSPDSPLASPRPFVSFNAQSSIRDPQSTLPPDSAIQLHNSYLVVESADGMLIIDQHALHERIMYEELLARVSRGPLESQRMLIPEVIDVSSTQLALLEQVQPVLQRMGIEVAAFGPQSVAIQAFPTFLDRLEPGTFVRELLERGEQELLDLHHEELLHEVLDMMACKAAVKAGDPLTPQEIQALIARRDLVDRSSNCPHGRPTTLRLSLRDLEKQFKRTGF